MVNLLILLLLLTFSLPIELLNIMQDGVIKLEDKQYLVMVLSSHILKDNQ